MEEKETAALRDAAEARLKAEPITAPASGADIDLLRLVHELQVREIELEMQNNELRQSRAEREAALARYTELYDFAPVGYLTLTADSLIEEINLTGAKLLGVERGNLMQKRFASFVVSEDQDRWARFLAGVKSQEGQEHVELRLQRRDDTVFHAQLDCVRHRVLRSGAPKVGADGTAISAAGSTLEVSIALTDISVRKGVEAKLIEATAAAEKASRAKTDFLSSMSHELRTPLNAILGFAQILESGTPPPTPSQQRDIGQILQAGWYLLELINEILDLALIESGKVMLSHEVVSLADVMFECQAMVESQAQTRGIGLSFPRSEIPYFVSADRTRVKQVLINLLFNAIKYNKPEGTVAVEYVLIPPNSIRISIRDTGVGLTPEQLTQLFQAFNRLGKEAGAEEQPCSKSSRFGCPRLIIFHHGIHDG
ncbi:MAG: ATP-binding protein [Sulfuritalea sp.]|jgi:signal transduction histidine kinase|nr:ATP-binding protein [Sulfuritalea sp.]